jgi:iron complex outermembrane receptor protein
LVPGYPGIQFKTKGREKMRKFMLIIMVGCLNLAGLAYAESGDVELDKIVVTPYRYAEILTNVASSVTVITPEDIKNSNAEKVVDVLRPIQGVTVRDFYGNGVTATVDMAGFGEQAALNVLVLIDGRRVNEVDLSGVNWSQIPLDQVERIEVIRGGSGAVLYGDNASSGVINIITKKGSGNPKVKLQTGYGSYDMNKQKLSFEGGLDNKFSYLFNIGREATHGYRENTFDKANDFASKLEYSFTNELSVHFNSGFHASTYGIPAALFQHHINEHSRRWARYGDDHANNKDYYFVLGSKVDFSGFGCFDIDFNYRQNDTDSYFPTSNNDTRKNKLETFGVTPKYTLSNRLLDHDNKLVAGLDFYKTFYNSNNYSPTNDAVLKNLSSIHKISIGSYLQNEFSIFKQLVLVGGYRYETARYVFGYHDNATGNPDRDAKLKPRMEAFNAGLVYTYKDDSSVFFNAGKSFRFPEVDEFTGQNDLFYHQFLNTNLKPQSSLNYQLGLRHKFTERLKGGLSLFRMNVKDYIYFNPSGGIGFGENENYDKTIHEGLESSLEAKLNNWINFFGNYTFTNAYFDGDQYSGNKIPMVPRHMGTLGLRFLMPKNLTFNITANYAGKRYFINDQANAVSQLNGYMVADTNLSWRCKDLTVTFGINNIFNKQYSEYGVYGFDSSTYLTDKAYYPSPGRNFSLKVDYNF